jgi:DNA (cytosine-5)-methyltransferase 1
MSKPLTVASLFSGGGLKTIGAIAAGFTPVLSVEYDPRIAAIYRKNLGTEHLIESDVRSVDYLPWRGKVDLLKASPACTRISVANADAGETELDISCAEAVGRAIREMQPRAVWIENVRQYQNTVSLTRIMDTLTAEGYFVDIQVVNAADYGVPQSRFRMILRAMRDGFPPQLPAPVEHVGWYSAIEDLIPNLSTTQLAGWQLDRLKLETLDNFLVRGVTDGFDGADVTPIPQGHPAPVVTASQGKHPMRAIIGDFLNTSRDATRSVASDPCMTVTCSNAGRRPKSMPRVFLLEGTSAGDRAPQVKESDDPAFTICAGSGGRVHRAIVPKEQHNGIGHLFGDDADFYRIPTKQSEALPQDKKESVMQILEKCAVLAVDSRCMARFQTVPDWYQLSGNSQLDATNIGNGVPCLLAQRTDEQIAEALR